MPPLTGREVARPELAAKLLALLTGGSGGTIAMTTALKGAGGFGKSTLARSLVHDPAVQQRFPDGIVWVTLGEDVSGLDLADRVDDICAVMGGAKPSLADPHLAGAELGRVLAQRRLLLVIDDVWSRPQLEPLPAGR